MKSLFCTMTVACLVAVTPADAAVLLDTGPTTRPGSIGWLLSPQQKLGVRLTFATQTTIQSIATQLYSDLGATIGINLTAESGGLPGGSLFATSLFVPRQVIATQEAAGLSWSVAPGRYWLTFETAGDALANGFAPNGVGSANEAFTRDGKWLPGEAEQALALRIGGISAPAAIPEPASWALMIAGFGAVAGAMRRRRPAVRYAA